MAVLNLDEPREVGRFALWYLGFRPFFLAAGIWAVVSVGLWLGLYALNWELPLAGIPPHLWHAHEMVFGYALAVIAGFLLTAVKNWTHVQTWDGWRLAALFSLWLAARLLLLLGDEALRPWGQGINLLFIGALVVAIAGPILRQRQWGQLVVILVPTLIALAQALSMGVAVRAGAYVGLFLVLLLIFLMGRRVIPFFIERGVDEEASLPNPLWLDIACIALFLAYAVSEFLGPLSLAASLFAGLAALAHGLRLLLWHHPGIWRKPLLWVLWIGYAFIVLGLVLRALAWFWPSNPFISIHALTYGGIGVITLGMMARVTIGHSGRNVFEPPALVGPMFALLIAGALVRVVLPLIWPGVYEALMVGSQLLWMAAFGLFVWAFGPMLWWRRIDGRYG